MNENRRPIPDFPVFDGHNDVLMRLFGKAKADAASDFVRGDNEGHLDLPRIKKAGFAGGMFAIYIPSDDIDSIDDLMQGKSYDVPLAKAISQDDALPIAMEMAATLIRIERQSAGTFKIVKSVNDIRHCISIGVVAAVMHMEGAEAIAADLDALDVFYQAGLRSIGPVWSRPNIFGHGVPFRFPSTGDTGPGLTDIGKELIAVCGQLGIAIDLSHITEQGFWDVAKLTGKPLIASHSNAHAICPSARNLTDNQLFAIKDSGGMVGLNFATCFLDPAGQNAPQTSFETMLRHLDYLIEKLGTNHVGFGSDFDGAGIPEVMGDVSGLGDLQSAMRGHGYDDELMRKITHENWLKVLETTWGA